MTKTREKCLNKLHSFMKEPNRKFSTYRLAISVADFAHQNGIQASELNTEYKRIRSF